MTKLLFSSLGLSLILLASHVRAEESLGAFTPDTPEECRTKFKDAKDLQDAYNDAKKFNEQAEDGPVKQGLKALVDQVQDTYQPCGKPLDGDVITGPVDGADNQADAQADALGEGERKNVARSKECGTQRDTVDKRLHEQMDNAQKELQADQQKQQDDFNQIKSQGSNGQGPDAYQRIQESQQKHSQYQATIRKQLRHIMNVGNKERDALDRLSKCHEAMAQKFNEKANQSKDISAMTRDDTPESKAGCEMDEEVCKILARKNINGALRNTYKVGEAALAEGEEGAASKAIAPLSSFVRGRLGNGVLNTVETFAEGAAEFALPEAGATAAGLAIPATGMFIEFMGTPAGGGCVTDGSNALASNAGGCTMVPQSVNKAVSVLRLP